MAAWPPTLRKITPQATAAVAAFALPLKLNILVAIVVAVADHSFLLITFLKWVTKMLVQ